MTYIQYCDYCGRQTHVRDVIVFDGPTDNRASESVLCDECIDIRRDDGDRVHIVDAQPSELSRTLRAIWE